MSEYEQILEQLSEIQRLITQVQQDTGKVHRSMSQSTRVVSQIDDDFLRRLIHGIEHMANGYAGEYGHEDGLKNVEWAMDGDYFLAYQEARAMMVEAYPDLYPEDEG